MHESCTLHVCPQSLQFFQNSVWQLFYCTGRSRLSVFTITLHPFDSGLDEVQNLEPNRNSWVRHILPSPLGSFPYLLQGDSDTSVEELPLRENPQEVEGVFLFESLKTVRATLKESEIGEWLFIRVALKDVRGNLSRIERIPRNQSSNQLAPGPGEFVRKRLRKLYRRLVMLGLSLGPLPPLNVYGLLPLGYHSGFSSLALLVRSLQCHQHGNERRDRGEPGSYCGDSSPVEIASNAPLETRRQVIKFTQLQFPLWSGRHSAMQRDTGGGYATLATIRPPRNRRTRLREDV